MLVSKIFSTFSSPVKKRVPPKKRKGDTKVLKSDVEVNGDSPHKNESKHHIIDIKI